jgi:O-antigen/teichoic acid export membrane protein
MARRGQGLLRLGSTLLAVGSLGMLAAPITIMAGIDSLHARTGRHALAGALGLTTVAVLECVLALGPIRRGERWALVAAVVPFIVVGIPVLVVDGTYVARERVRRTLAPQVIGLLVGGVALLLCALGQRAGAGRALAPAARNDTTEGG